MGIPPHLDDKVPRPPFLLILFGLPGAGKSFAGQLLSAEFDFTFHEADEDIPTDYRQRVIAGQVVGEAMRDAYHRHLIERMAGLWNAHPRLAVAAPLLRDRHRIWIYERFPRAVFVQVQCNSQTWQARLQARTHTISLEYALKVASLNEPVTVPHGVLENSREAASEVRAQLARLLDQSGAVQAHSP